MRKAGTGAVAKGLAASEWLLMKLGVRDIVSLRSFGAGGLLLAIPKWAFTEEEVATQFQRSPRGHGRLGLTVAVEAQNRVRV